MVSFHRGIEDRLSAYRGEAVLDYVREVRGERHGQGTEIRLIAAGCEGSTGRSLPSHQLPNPANGFRLDSRSGLRPVETGELRIQRGDQGLGEERHVGRRRIHHPKIVCAGNVEPVVDQFTADLIENSARVFPGLGEPAKTGRINPVLGGGLNWTIGQRSKKPVYHFNKLVPEFAARLRIKVKIHRRLTMTEEADSGLSGLSSRLLSEDRLDPCLANIGKIIRL